MSVWSLVILDYRLQAEKNPLVESSSFHPYLQTGQVLPELISLIRISQKANMGSIHTNNTLSFPTSSLALQVQVNDGPLTSLSKKKVLQNVFSWHNKGHRFSSYNSQSATCCMITKTMPHVLEFYFLRQHSTPGINFYIN